MSWKRGAGDVELELSRTQDWIESMDPKLNGNGRIGLIDQYWQDRAFIKGALWVIIFLLTGDLGVRILEYIRGVVK